MKTHKFTSTDAFVVFDLDDAPAVGITRRARKVLHDGAVLLARDTTYAFASFGLNRGGGSAGVNADDDARDSAVAAFVAEATDLVRDGAWATDPGLGVTADDLAPLYAVDARPAALWTDGAATDLIALGAIAAADAVLDGGVSGASASVVGAGPLAAAVRDALAGSGAGVDGDSVGATADVVFVAGKTGAVDHEAAADVAARVVVPLTPAPVTARAHAVLTQAGRVHVPSFLSTAAPLLAAYDADAGNPVDRIGAAVSALVGSPDLWMAAAERAEDHLRTWQDSIPTFRPLA